MKLTQFKSLIQDVIKKTFPARFLFENLTTKPTDLIQSILSKDVDKFLELLPKQTEKELNQVYLFKKLSYTVHEEEIFVGNAKSIFELAIESGEESIVLALIKTQKIDLMWKNKDNVNQINLLFYNNNLSIKPIDVAIDCILAQKVNLSEIKINKKNPHTLLELLALNTVGFQHPDNKEKELLEVNVAKKLVKSKIDINHEAHFNRGNALNLAVLALKPLLTEYLLSLNIEKREVFDNLSAPNANVKNKTLMGQAISQGFLQDSNHPDGIFSLVKILHEAGFKYQDVCDWHQDDSGRIENYSEKVKSFLDILEEKSKLDVTIEIPSVLNEKKNLAKRKI